MRLLNVFAVIYFCAGCSKADIKFGEEYVENDYTNIVLTDTLTPLASTVYLDSVPSSGSGTLLIGNYNDPLFGQVSAHSYLHLQPPVLEDLSTNAAYDSLVLILPSHHSFYGDTTAMQEFEVRQLRTRIELDENNTQLHNTHDVPVQAEVIGTKKVVMSPGITDSLRIPLNDIVGQNLFTLFKAKAVELENVENFIAYFKGLRIGSAGSTAMKAVYGFKDSAILRLYYHQSNLLREEKHADFTLTDKNLQYNKVVAARAGTATAIFSGNKKEIASDATNQQAYMQPITGLAIKVQFPSLRTLLEKPDYVKILRAELTVRPVKKSYAGYALPPFLSAGITDASNDIQGYLNSNNSSEAVNDNGSLSMDDVYGENTTYTYDVTSYLQSQILIAQTNRNGILLQSASPADKTSLNRLVIGDRKHPASKIELKLYYVSVQ